MSKLIELISIFGSNKANEIYKKAIESDGIYRVRRTKVVHEISVSHCGNRIDYKRVVNPWYINMVEKI